MGWRGGACPRAPLTATPYRSPPARKPAPPAERRFPRKHNGVRAAPVAIVPGLGLGALIIAALVEAGVHPLVLIPVSVVAGALSLAVAARGALEIWDVYFGPPVTVGEEEILVPRQSFRHIRHLTLRYGEISRVEHWSRRASPGGLRLHYAGGSRNIPKSGFDPVEWDFMIRLLRRAYDTGRLDAAQLDPAPLVTLEMLHDHFEIPEGLDPRPTLEHCYRQQISGRITTVDEALALALDDLRHRN